MLSVLGKITLNMKFGEGCIVYPLHERERDKHEYACLGHEFIFAEPADLLEKL